MKRILRFIFLHLLLLEIMTGSSTPAYLFETIDITHGLSLNSVKTIAKDKYGFMWFGTEDGLNRYDGISFKTFRHNPLDSTSINSSSVYSTLVDNRGNLWIGTYLSGLNKYNYETERFIQYPHDPLDSLSIGEGTVYALHEDHHGNIWVGTSGAGLFRFDPETGQSTPLKYLVSNGVALSDSVVHGLFEDHTHKLWISTFRGLNVLDLNNYELKNYINDPDDPSTIFDNNARHVFETFDGHDYRIWIGTNWGGFDQYDLDSDSFIHHGFKSEINPHCPETSVIWMIQENEDRFWAGTDSKGILVMDMQGHLLETIGRKVYDDSALNDDVIQSIYDDGHIIWVATSAGGVGKYIRDRKKFFSLTYDPLDPSSLHDERILQIRDDSKGNLWIATWSEGITYYDTREKTFTEYMHDPDDPGSLSDNGVQDILVDQNDNLWVISASLSLDLLRNGSSTFEHIEANSDIPNGLQSELLTSLYEDKNGYIWLGSWDEGLIKLDPGIMEFQTYREPAINNISLGNISLYSMFEDSRGMLWLGPENEGLIAFDRDNLSLKQFKSISGDPYALPNNDVMCFHEDEDGYIWLGTYGGGLSKFDPLKNTFENFGIEHGLLSETIYKIFEDLRGHLWISTNNGLARFDKHKKIFKTYTLADGVLSKEFNPAGCIDDKGWLYFGGVKGITYFDPDQIKDNKYIPPIQFTDLSIMNHHIQVNKKYNNRIVLNSTITDQSEIQLFPDDLFFSISFASLDYYHSPSNEYAYFLEGFEDKWRYIGNQRSVTFTNLAPGKYTLHVKGSNNDGVWNEEGAKLQIVVHPKFWETWWFIYGSVLLILLGFFMLYRLRTSFLLRRAEEFKQHNIELNTQIKSRKKAHREARERADYFRAVISQSPIPMAIHNIEGHITHLNDGWINLWGVANPDKMIGNYQIDHDPLARQLSLDSSFKKAVLGKVIEHPEVKFIAHDGKPRVVRTLLYPLKDESGSTNQVMISLEDVTEIAQHRNLLEKSLNEKELLLKEVHHRIKNNLQIIASLLGLQKAGIDDKVTIQTLDEFKNRINSMALVHDALYRSSEFDNIDMATYIRGLTADLQAAFRQEKEPVELISEIPEITLPVDIAVPCGLMINELVTNALKHAFPDPAKTDKQICVSFTHLKNDDLRLEVRDNGVGFQHPVVWDSVKSLGLYLVKILSEQQLMGKVELINDSGSYFIIEFPLHPDFDD